MAQLFRLEKNKPAGVPCNCQVAWAYRLSISPQHHLRAFALSESGAWRIISYSLAAAVSSTSRLTGAVASPAAIPDVVFLPGAMFGRQKLYQATKSAIIAAWCLPLLLWALVKCVNRRQCIRTDRFSRSL